MRAMLSKFQDRNRMQSDKQKHRPDEEVISELCASNGLSYEKIAQDASDITSLEMFFSGFPRMVGLSSFPGLCQLTIVGQDISHIHGLDGCPLLQELWVAQCHLTEIAGLEKCVILEKLYLYDNQISEIKNLDLQINLEVLWLSNNCIRHIQGLNTLQNLRELNLADNMIEKIGNCLDPNVNLQNLNLSGNKIRSFKELTHLACLPQLRELALQDPTSTSNPVCLLCNYAIHVLYHLPGLQRLDSYDVSSKQVKEAAESTVLKKMMYYNMRVRSAHRKLAEAQVSLAEKKKALLQLPEESVRALSHALKNLERELPVVSAGQPRGQAAGKSNRSSDVSCDIKIHTKMRALRERLAVWTKKLQEIEGCYERDLARTISMTEYTVQFLLIELESVGNIRLEEGSPKDLWFTSCCDLLLSRFCHSDYELHGITGIKIDRVIRIYNSSLRFRFEDKLHSLLCGEDGVVHSQNVRRRLEHLFYINNPQANNEKEEIISILEDGFKPAEEYKTSTREHGVPLTNSLNVMEQPRIEHALRQASQCDTKHSVDPVPFRHSQVIISKVYVGHSMPDREKEGAQKNSNHRVCSLYRTVDAKNKSGPSDERPRSAKAHAAAECVIKQRQWFVLDHELVLPEYIVFFQYVTEKLEQPASVGRNKNKDENSNVVLDKEVLCMEPMLKPQPKLLSLDDKILLNVAKANVLSQITVLNLHGNSLSRIKEISCLTALKHLTLSFNEFTRLDDISQPSLEFLDLSFNHLLTLEGLKGLGQLKHLDLRWNKLTKARHEAGVLRKHTPALLKLDTRHNPWNRRDPFRMSMLGRLTTLTHLDDTKVTEEEIARAVALAAESRFNQASVLAHSRTLDHRPRSLSLLSSAQLLCLLIPPSWSQELEPNWMTKITALNLENQKISKLISIHKLVNLRWANFNDNDISKVEGMDSCLKLEELSLNNNCIVKLSGLSKLTSLSKLSLDGNRLSSLDATVLDQLPNLTFLSVENNCITSLHGIQRVRNLLEFYIGNNRISASRDIYYLKTLTNLIILDFYGNPLVEKLDNYRIYVVFHVPSLKALDGTAVEVVECENAKDMYGGRLTTDMVAEKLGHSNYADITYLTLLSCSLRSVDLSPADKFNSLQSINLDHNNLTSFSGLVYLPNVKALCLNYNHIESILPRQRSQTLTSRQILHSKVHSSGYGQQIPVKSHRDAGPAGSLEPLMGSLEVLHLSHNGISNMANLQLSRLTNLKALFLQGNEISQVEGLEGLQQLRELVLDRNRIKSLSENSFVGQNLLLELHLDENRIRELNHLEPLTELRKLFLGMNKLQDLTELEKLEVLPSLTELSVVGNPVARNSFHRSTMVLHLTQLQILDGVMVTVEERTRAELLSSDASYPGASLLSTEMNPPGLLPLVPRNTAARGMSLSGGLQSFLHAHDILSTNMEEIQAHNKYKKQKSSYSRSGEVTFRHIRRTASVLPSPSLLSDGHRVVSQYHHHDQETRLPNGCKPPPL